MTETEIMERLERAVVELLPTRRVLLANDDRTPQKPYLIVEISPTSRVNETIDCTPEALVSSGRMIVTVVSVAGEFAKPGRVIADEIIAAFPKGLRLGLSSGSVLIKKPADILGGYRDGPDWRTPVRIDYEVEL